MTAEYFEWNETDMLIRMMWQRWSRKEGKYKGKRIESCGLGLLLSTYLDDKFTDKPKIFTQLYYNNGWHQAWIEY